ncbi:MAG: hydroxymethylbilane synthase [bacterium]|nr:hydroxymethylbilane synthase [bacterium]
MSATLRLGTRGSKLALWQAHHVSKMISNQLGRECEIVVIKTQGDQIHNVAFHKMEGKGFFTKELQEALLDERIDFVVHSLKDLPTEEPPGLQVAALPERQVSSDILIARPGILNPQPADPLGLPEGSTLGTSSLRRAAQSLSLNPQLSIKALRGNVPTRVEKLRSGDYDAILLATAGVQRLDLDLSDLENSELPPEVMLPAPGQGALAIEARADSDEAEILSQLHDPEVARCVNAERSLLQLLGGGCHLPLGTLATACEDGIRLQAVLGEVDEEISHATVSRVGCAAPDGEAAARGCFEALRLAAEHAAKP